ncbi:hypothetical protein B0T10DRAFT_234709 [Thelonectria olida]|uniref:BAH domain-containing protein n=1 Tax=Thelonectria olida TaxID=1576542 RepID=A0A9P8VUJ3_9HYPO|nr:hypothetical protein B0T10DRAFT_234709 [Thelonectria olida]
MSSGKRRPSVLEGHYAPYRFTITLMVDPSQAGHKRPKNKKRKCQHRVEQAEMQTFPFLPSAHTALALYYSVDPKIEWQNMTRYNSFVLNRVKYYSDSFVRVANECTIERQRAAMNLSKDGLVKNSENDWVAWILEIRAANEHRVYARVYWMYSPDELPAETICGKKRIQGRQPYHGRNELIASNHMDIINVVSIIEPATVGQWIESDDDETMDELYWRQTFNYLDSQLSPVKLLCECKTPENPDRTLIGCTSTTCGKWMHQECLHHDVLMRVYNRLGTEKPQQSESMTDLREDNDSNPTRPLSPKDVEKEEMQPIIDEVDEDVHVQEATPPTPRAFTLRTKVLSANAQAKPPTNKSCKKSTDSEPYLGLFEATLKLDDGPTTWTIRDLRENVLGSEKIWDERVHCLLCGVIIG